MIKKSSNYNEFSGFFAKIKEFLARKRIYFEAAGIDENLLKIADCAGKGRKYQRELEFRIGRLCVKRALQRMGMKNRPVRMGRVGEPVFPSKVCGTLSHTKSACCAATAYKNCFLSLGIDMEISARRMSGTAIEHILNDDEKERILCRKRDMQKLAKFVFCAKESIFKLFFPLVRKKFYFDAVSIDLPSKGGKFSFVLNTTLGKKFRKGNIYKGYYFQDANFAVVLTFLNLNLPVK